MILDHPKINQHIFFPRPTDLEPNLRVDVGNASLGCYVRRPYSEAGLVLHFHGNGELAAEYARTYAKFFLEIGVNVCFAEYRGYGQSTGSPGLVAMLADGERIVQALGIEPERLVVVGRSVGSLYAIELVHRIPQIAGLIIDSGIAGFSEWLAGKPWWREAMAESSSGDVAGNSPLPEKQAGLSDAELAREISSYFDQRRKLEGYEGKALILHAQKDQLLAPTHAERLHAWAGGKDKRLIVFPTGDHNTIFAANRASYVRELEAFFRRAGMTALGPGGGN
jgi:pimeloyl-ACP methyl ester carboxylesterase